MQKGSDYGGQFFNDDENQVCTIGTGYIANFVAEAFSFGAKRAGATLTDRRIYFSGTVFRVTDGGDAVKIKERKVVNTRDVTGTGYVFYNPIKWLVFAGIMIILSLIAAAAEGFFAFFLGALVAAGFVAIWYFKRMTLFTIEYAGGNIAFDVRLLQSHEQDDFVRNIHLMKDALYGTSAVAQGFVAASQNVDINCPQCGEPAKKGTSFCRKCGGAM